MKYIEIGKLKPNKDNPRRIAHRDLEKLAQSISDNPEYFEARPIICNNQFIIYAGHQRYKAAKMLQMDKVPVHVMDLPDAKMREIMIRDNVNSGVWDEAILAEDWDMDVLVDFGMEFKHNAKHFSDDRDETPDGLQPKGKKPKAKKIIQCPHCDHEIEI